jgi:hypothetical protein
MTFEQPCELPSAETNNIIDSKGFWWLYVTLRIAVFLLCLSSGVHCTLVSYSGYVDAIFSHHLRKETDSVSEKLCFLVLRISDDGQNRKPQYFWSNTYLSKSVPVLETMLQNINYFKNPQKWYFNSNTIILIRWVVLASVNDLKLNDVNISPTHFPISVVTLAPETWGGV